MVSRIRATTVTTSSTLAPVAVLTCRSYLPAGGASKWPSRTPGSAVGHRRMVSSAPSAPTSRARMAGMRVRPGASSNSVRRMRARIVTSSPGRGTPGLTSTSSRAGRGQRGLRRSAPSRTARTHRRAPRESATRPSPRRRGRVQRRRATRARRIVRPFPIALSLFEGREHLAPRHARAVNRRSPTRAAARPRPIASSTAILDEDFVELRGRDQGPDSAPTAAGREAAPLPLPAAARTPAAPRSRRRAALRARR